MWTFALNKTVAENIDKFVLYTLNRRLPDSFETSYREAPTFETVLAQTRVNGRKTAVYSITAPGEHFIWLDTTVGELRCRIHVRPAVDPAAPLVMFHHGFNEMPYDLSWKRIFYHPDLSHIHAVAVQAPFHESYMQPTAEGLATVQNAYQMFACSLRMMEQVQSCFEMEGVVDTAVTGVSWGGTTSLLYEGVFQRTKAVIPLLSSPNLAQVMWDIARLFDRPLTVSQQEIFRAFDFTSYYERCDPDKVFPLLGEHDRFFRLEHHGDLFAASPLRERPYTTIPDGHITGHMKVAGLRQHILDALAQTIV
ncbi:MAG: alpha/beta hydrolase family protein [Ardenticatenaceae bacterium]|nr:alpha/beta hydrolase family protein [Ardenticatenaceae bacterium]MCB9444321.1 alpha/beta hydrolase family protein [Ardenticatenaceae bacterium]